MTHAATAASTVLASWRTSFHQIGSPSLSSTRSLHLTHTFALMRCSSPSPIDTTEVGRRCKSRQPLRAGLSTASRQGQEELLHLLHVETVDVAVTGGEALLQSRGDDREAGAVQRLGHRGQLGDHVLAVATLLEKPQHAGELPLCALDAVDDGRHLVGIELHRCSSSGWAGGGCRGPSIPPGVFCVSLGYPLGYRYGTPDRPHRPRDRH